jgi:hypothetical protein
MKERVGPTDRVIVCTHEPVWALDAYDGAAAARSPLVKELLSVHIKDRVALRLAGDVHNYMCVELRVVGPVSWFGLTSCSRRHVRVTQQGAAAAAGPGSAPVLIVSGGGGAFLHPTHTFPTSLVDMQAKYDLAKAYPDRQLSRQLAVENLGSGALGCGVRH